jgi:hypothetical protein
MRITKICLLLLLILSVSIPVFAQAKKRKQKLEYSGFFDSYYYRGPLSVTVGAGLSAYRGDYFNGFYKVPSGFNFNIGANYRVWPRVVFGAEFSYFTLASSYINSVKTTDSLGVESIQKTTLRSFSGSGYAVELYGRFYLIEDIIRRSTQRKKLQTSKLYIIGGIGIVNTGSGMTPAFPVGMGYSYSFSNRISLLVEATHRFMFSDELDKMVSTSPKNDAFGLISLKLQYSPFAPRGKKNMTAAPAEPNTQREEHQEWRKKKKEEPKPVENTEELPNENQENQENPENQEQQENQENQENKEEQTNPEENKEK